MLGDKWVHHQESVIGVEHALPLPCPVVEDVLSFAPVEGYVESPEELLFGHIALVVVGKVLLELGMLLEHLPVEMLDLDARRALLHPVVRLLKHDVLRKRGLLFSSWWLCP